MDLQAHGARKVPDRSALGCVVNDADRAADIIDRIRDHIRKAPPRKHRFDLNEAINEVIVLARSAIAKNGVLVQTRLTEGLAPVQGDCVQLQQVVLNLILNAIEAMGSVEAGPRELLIGTEQNPTDGVLAAETRGCEEIGCGREGLDAVAQRPHEPSHGIAKGWIILNDRDQ